MKRKNIDLKHKYWNNSTMDIKIKDIPFIELKLSKKEWEKFKKSSDYLIYKKLNGCVDYDNLIIRVDRGYIEVEGDNDY